MRYRLRTLLILLAVGPPIAGAAWFRIAGRDVRAKATLRLLRKLGIRSMLRFTIRDLLWLTLVLGMGSAWWSDHRRLLRERNEMERFAREAGAAVKNALDWPRPPEPAAATPFDP